MLHCCATRFRTTLTEGPIQATPWKSGPPSIHTFVESNPLRRRCQPRGKNGDAALFTSAASVGGQKRRDRKAVRNRFWHNEAYGLTPEEVALLWETAPPRMPFTPANS